MTVEKFESIKKEIDAMKSKRDRLQGSLDNLTKRMADEFGCKTVAELEEKVAQSKDSLRKLEEKFETGLRELEALVQA